MIFHARKDTLALIAEYMNNRHQNVRTEYMEMEHWNEMPILASTIAEDHLFVVVTARKGSVSYKNALERLPQELRDHVKQTNLMIIFPDQYSDDPVTMTFAEPQPNDQESAYAALRAWAQQKLKK